LHEELSEIERGINKLKGINNTNVNFAVEQALVTFDPKQLAVKDITNKIQRSGYNVAASQVELPLTGMTCTNCAANIE